MKINYNPKSRIHLGDFDSIAELLELSVDEISLLDCTSKFHLIYSMIQLSRYQDSLKLLTQEEDPDHETHLHLVYLFSAFLYSRQGFVEDTETSISKIDPSLDLNNFETILYKISSANLALHTRKLNQALKLYREILLLLENDMAFLRAYTLMQSGTVLLYQHKYDYALQYYKSANSLFLQIKNTEQIVSSFINLSNVYLNLHKFEESVTASEQAINYSTDSTTDAKKAGIFLNMGISKVKIGKLDLALKDFFKAEELLHNRKNLYYLARCYQNMGVVFDFKGRLNTSTQYYQKSLELYREINNRYGEMEVLINLGILERKKLEYSKVVEHFSHAWELNEDIQDPKIFLFLTCNFANFYLQTDEPDMAKMYLDLIDEDIVERSLDNKILYEYTKASINIASSNIIDRSRGIIALQELEKQEINEPDLYLDIVKKLCSIHLENYKKFGQNAKETLQEIENYLQKLNAVGLEQNSIIVMLQSLVLQAELYMYNKEYAKATNLLKEAFELSQDYSLNNYVRFISRKQEEFLDFIKKVEVNVNQFHSILEEMDFIDFGSLVKSMVQSNSDQIHIPKEQPGMIFIIDVKKGISIYSHSFIDEYKDVLDQLIAAYLTAINQVIDDAFQKKGIIERIKHESQTILLKLMDQKFIICYVFQGTSYFAREKMNEFIETLHQSPQYQTFLADAELGRMDIISSIITPIADDVFG